MKMNYKQLIKWIYHNPRIVNINRLCVEADIKPQHFHYYIDNNIPMPKYLIQKVQVAFNLTDEEVNRFFYLVASYKK